MKLILRDHSGKAMKRRDAKTKFYSPANVRSGHGQGIRSNNNTKEIVEDKRTIFDKKHLQTWILVFVLMVITAGVAVAIFLSLRTSWRSERQEPQDITFGKEYEDNIRRFD